MAKLEDRARALVHAVKTGTRVAADAKPEKRSEVLVGYGTDGKDMSFQNGFEEKTKCVKCGKNSRLGLVVKEEYPSKTFVMNFRPDDGCWPHDCIAAALYFCSDVKCASVTTIWDQA